ncbi:MAG TPA: hypothetical protein VGO56_08715 [Pyrinomonadaceae bacterium]|jgi:hypothetical protein|nr:hypothetical protein [Pyrinomonadaceae bacterium]
MKRLTVSFIALFLFGVTTHAQSESLQGLAGFRVVVEDVDSKVAARRSLSVSQIQTDVELRLRRNGIRVLTEAEWNHDARSPTLYINLHLVLSGNDPGEEGLYAYNISVEVKQGVLLKSSPAKDVLATTWDKAATGTVGSDNLGVLRSRITDLVDFAANDYLAANPKRGN